MEWWEFILLGLATWRITGFLIYEKGPFVLLRRFRRLFGIRVTDDGVAYRTNHFGSELWSCLWCMSFWVGLAVFTLASLVPYVEYAFYGLALSSMAILIEKVVGIPD